MTTVKKIPLIERVKNYLDTQKINIVWVKDKKICVRNELNQFFEIDIKIKNDIKFWEELEKFAEYINAI